VTALHVVYDLGANPASYDFPAFLCGAERHRLDSGLDAIDVYFMPGIEGEWSKQFPRDSGQRNGLLHRVAVPCCRLLPSVRNVHILKDRCAVPEPVYPTAYVADKQKSTHGSGHFVDILRCLRATDQARAWVARHFSVARYVTITIRQADYGVERNSIIPEWQAVALWIRGRGYQPVIVPDTFGGKIGDFRHCIQAAWDVDLRLALYEGAVLNIGVGNGPLSLCFMAQTQYRMFTTYSSKGNTKGQNIVRDVGTRDVIVNEINPLLPQC